MSENGIEDALDLGKWLGRRQAFSLIAGRCSAADAKCLRELRESKQYKLLGLTWEECCKQRAGIGRSTADQIIQNLEEFGPDYFVLAQVTGIPAKEYRQIQGSISNHALLHAGEEIPIEADNAPRLVAAVEALRGETAATQPADGGSEAKRRLEKVERAFRTAFQEIERLDAMPLDDGERGHLRVVIGSSLARLGELDD